MKDVYKQITKDDKVMLSALKATLQEYRVPNSEYSILEPKEDALCIVLNDETRLWEIFYCERNYKHRLKTYSSLSDACHRFLYEQSYNQQMSEIMILSFRRNLQQNQKLLNIKTSEMFKKQEMKVTRVSVQEGFLIEIVEEEDRYGLWLGNKNTTFKMYLWPEHKDQTVDEIFNKLKEDPGKIQNFIAEYRFTYITH